MLHLLKGSREELAKYIKEQNKKIVVYGAGMIGKVIIPDYLLPVSYTHLTLPTILLV